MRLFVLLLAFSAVMHFFALYCLPAFGFIIKKPDEKAPVYLEVRQIEIPKPKPPRKDVSSRPAPRPAETLAKPSEKASAPSVPAFVPSGADTPLVLPDIVVPKSFTEATPEISVPDIIGTPDKKNPPVPKGPPVDKELASLEAGRIKSDKININVGEEAGRAGEISLSGQIYNFDVMPTNDRRVSYVPPEPDFELSNDAKITVKFSINKNGNTSDIEFITHSSNEVENMASDYIKKMRFDAVMHDEKDYAQITITFKVRK